MALPGISTLATSGAVALIAVLLVHRAQVQLRSWRIRTAMARSHRVPELALVNRRVVVAGTLLGPSDGILVTTFSRFEGDPLATSAAESPLRLVLEDGAVELHGPIEVIAGSNEEPSKLPGSLVLKTCWGSARMLRSGDQVVAVGVLDRREGECSSYRHTDIEWILRPGHADKDAVLKPLDP